MTNRVSASAWKIVEVEKLLASNHCNTLTYLDAAGVACIRQFSEVRRDALAVIALLRKTGCPMEPGRRGAICGGPGYPWLLVAVACIMSGVEIVAAPELLTDHEMTASLDGLQLDFVASEKKYGTYESFAALPRTELDHLCEAIVDIEPADEPVGPAAFSVVAFTSGSTSGAKLKSFRVSAESTEAFIDTFCDAYHLTHDDNWVVCHPFSHVVHFEYAIGGLCRGYDVTIAEPLQVMLSGAQIRPSVLVTVPSVYQQMVTLIKRKLPKNGPRRALIDKLFEQSPADEEASSLAKDLQSVLLPEIARLLGDRLKVMIIGAAPSTEELKRTLVLMGLPVYEGYGMSETNMLASNLPGKYRFGTVGPVWPGVEIRLTDESIIQARVHPVRSKRYLNTARDECERTFLADGWVDTGDFGEIDDGLLRITGRAKEIIITDRGKNINPAAIQSKLQQIGGIGHAIVFGNDKPYLVAVLTPAEHDTTLDRDTVAAAVEAVNETLSTHEQVRDWLILSHPFTEASGLLTRSGKPRRSAIELRFAAELGALYE
ncbi:AMP-binding protein [Fluviibacter phosphoraccumulans]|uniref:AMP-binding protein n=1 Tax=Fluviibacter phosphoraccumulans TaxID=1751046 RepID=UPI0010B1A994|nr:AMP-binding protein [Fluviibacter phosphoraccumulans]BCA64670.1 long-chain-fatty-acid--CoA ligase [Fluviibacter phosphoraccumulans]